MSLEKIGHRLRRNFIEISEKLEAKARHLKAAGDFEKARDTLNLAIYLRQLAKKCIIVVEEEVILETYVLHATGYNEH